MRARLSAFLASVATAALLTGCPSVDRALDQHGAAAKAPLAALLLAHEDLRTRAPVTADAVAPIEGGQIVLRGEDRSLANAAVLYDEDLEKPAELANVYARLEGSEAMPDCAAFLAHKTYAWDPARKAHWSDELFGPDVGKALDFCGRVRTLFVIRTLELVKPGNARMDTRIVATAPALDAGARKDAGSPGDASVWGPPVGLVSESACRGADVRCRFDGGHVMAEVHVFTVQPFAHKGAFLLDAESATSVPISGDTGEHESELERDLRRRVGAVLVEAVRKNIPNADVRGWQ